MNELSQAISMLGKLSTAILRCPTGRYTLVGSVPASLCQRLDRFKRPRLANVYESERAAIDALLSAGVERFQLSDCSWYQGKGAE